MPSSNIFAFLPQEETPGTDNDPLQMSGIDDIVFNTNPYQPSGGGYAQPVANQVPIPARTPMGPPGAVASAFMNEGFQLPSGMIERLSGGAGVPSNQLLNALQQAFLIQLFGNQ